MGLKNMCYWVGMIPSIKRYHSIRLWKGVGKGTNTDVELLALWVLLWFAKKKGILETQIAGDSNAVIKWDNGTSSL